MPSFFDLVKENIELPLYIDGKLEWILTTDFDSKEYNKIFELYPDKEYPIMLDENYKPIVKDGELARDSYNIEVKRYNDTQELYRMASQLKLVVKNSDVKEMPLEDIIDILQNLGFTFYQELQLKIYEILRAKYSRLNEYRGSLARQILATSDSDKTKRDKYITQQEKEIEKLSKREKEIELLIKDCKHDKQLKDYYKQLKDIENQIREIRSIIYPVKKDDIKTSNGITNDYIILEIAEKYKLNPDFIIKILKNDLSKEEECLVELMKAKYSLDAEESKRQYDNMNGNNGNKKGSRD